MFNNPTKPKFSILLSIYRITYTSLDLNYFYILIYTCTILYRIKNLSSLSSSTVKPILE